MNSGRARIVEALNTVEGLTATPTTPDTPSKGSAWPVWEMTRFAGKLALVPVNDYAVLVVLPNGYAPETVEQADGFLPMVAAALAKVGTLTTAEPVAIQIADSSTMPGLRFRITPREATR